ncbi:ubiquinol-cytochrome c reductase complex assembly factor 2 [Petromyzon marinus]|uniref:Mitochondrial nucleoid factor 1 n=1 Tax=Petromyzon marinus TaxID=7757 RepID=S4RI34_PETMA|nr:ubiquinol-cytochrome-c reductase complex assembly factor 2 [Petromyzon marinus]
MAATRYRLFLRLCEEWRLEPSKRGRDLGEHLRARVAAAFREGEHTQIADPEKCDQMYESLVRMNTNYFQKKYPRRQNTSFTGMTAEDCRLILSTDNLEAMEDINKSFFKKFFEKFANKNADEQGKLQP